MFSHPFASFPGGRLLDAAEAAAVEAGFLAMAARYRTYALVLLPALTGGAAALLTTSGITFMVLVIPGLFVVVPTWIWALSFQPGTPRTTIDLQQPLHVVDGSLVVVEPDESASFYSLAGSTVRLPLHWKRVEGTGQTLVMLPVSPSGAPVHSMLRMPLVVRAEVGRRTRSLSSDVTKGVVSVRHVRFSHKLVQWF